MLIENLKTRYDAQGSGDFGAPRGDRIHKGRDFIADVGEDFPTIISGIVKRYAQPYFDRQEYSGIVIVNGPFKVKMFYLEPNIQIGSRVRRGQSIGIAQDVSRRYPSKEPGGEMRPHVHIELRIDGKLYDPIYLL